MDGVSGNIKRIREALGFAKSELARRTELTPAAISQFESGAKTPSLKTLEKIANALGVLSSDLLGECSEKEEIDASAQIYFKDFSSLSDEDKKMIGGLIRSFKEKSKESGD